MERIISKGGRVEPYFDDDGKPLGPYRVWKLNEDIPGLAMSRSFGDQCASSVGMCINLGVI
jgi:serine/threonine protein phosphatase PrpC